MSVALNLRFCASVPVDGMAVTTSTTSTSTPGRAGGRGFKFKLTSTEI